jgi:hypothetical protein
MHHVVVKDESNNLTFMVTILHSIVDYHLLKFHPYFVGYLFWSCHIKKCQYATNDNKVVTCLKHVNVKNA